MMKLGPRQEAWVKSLEDHPERQMTGVLGIGNPESYKACCLGEALCVLHKLDLIKSPFVDDRIKSGSSQASLDESDYEKLGLRSCAGMAEDNSELSLAEKNDNGVTWPGIAAILRSKPEIFFTKSV